MKLKLILFYFIALIAYGQRFVSINAVIDTSAKNLGSDKLPLGLIFQTKKGKTIKTTGFLGGNKSWSNIKVKTNIGKFVNGYLYFDYKSLNLTKDSIKISFSLNGHPTIKDEIKYKIPRIKNVQVTLPDHVIVPGFDHDQKYSITFDNEQTKTVAFNSNLGILSSLILKYNQTDQAPDLPLFLPSSFLNTKDSLNIQFVNAFDTSETYNSQAIKIRYSGVYRLRFDGRNGIDGSGGYNGKDSKYGPNGEHGQNGQHGSEGESGKDIQLIIEKINFDTGNYLVKYTICDKYKPEIFYLDPKENGNLSLTCNGGKGGIGGDGGTGGDGADEKQGTVAVSNGAGGDGGDGGDGGKGGNGGNIQILIDKEIAENILINQYFVSSRGGYGGEEGSGSKGGLSGKKISQNNSGGILKILLPDRGRHGRDGRRGIPGMDGKITKIFLTNDEIKNIDKSDCK